ncbi:hypothetical protein [Providencia vermicola]|uniref:hypothetical protein n=1 Tax=Providencia vermicola TaxID=333965 RepID=UPI00220EFEBD|nr:hypothetical protein NFC79_00775 [Providencia stuartii]
MLLLNKLLIDQENIFLAPGSYFHQEFSAPIYHQLPVKLQQQHNQYLIEKYTLKMPDNHTRALPSLFSNSWGAFPTIAITLGNLWQKESFNNNMISKENIPQSLSAFGAAQLLACLAPFGNVYVLRAKYMFSQNIQQLIPTYSKGVLPWNLIEEAFHRVNRSRN